MLYISSTTVNDAATRSNLFILNKKKEEPEKDAQGKPFEQIVEIPTKSAAKTYLYEYNVNTECELFIVQHHSLHSEVN